jgi:thymidylate synthase
MKNPRERVLFNNQRKANPYFHLMETVWMFAGGKNAKWLAQFNSQMKEYAEDNWDINGAYGHRWFKHFGIDQVENVAKLLRTDPSTRQAVIAMYDPRQDYLTHWKDRPCNTHIYFRVTGGCLDMTVCNRSNDVIWGLAGANIVHMTYLQELVSLAANIPLGRYYVMTNNLHIYEHHWHLMGNPAGEDYYGHSVEPGVLIQPNEGSWYEFIWECQRFINYDGQGRYPFHWLEHVVKPMYEHYICRLNGDRHTYDTGEVQADDWRQAAELWRSWHD